MSEQKKILLVDDDREVLELLKMTFEMQGFSVATAEDGLKGLQLARTWGPDVIILDLIMPLMEGYKVCRRLKADDKYRHIPILMLTGMAEKENKLIAFESEADDYETKPFEVKTIVTKVQALLAKKEEASS